jgi:hypothetical protein
MLVAIFTRGHDATEIAEIRIVPTNSIANRRLVRCLGVAGQLKVIGPIQRTAYFVTELDAGQFTNRGRRQTVPPLSDSCVR